MACDASTLRRVMDDYFGGSTTRYRHPLNPRMIFTEGVKSAADAAGAYWLIDLVALFMVDSYAAAWLAGHASIGIITVTVVANGAQGSQATVCLSLEDDAPDVFKTAIDMTDFPVGQWRFYLGTDEVGQDAYVTTMLLPQEY